MRDVKAIGHGRSALSSSGERRTRGANLRHVQLTQRSAHFGQAIDSTRLAEGLSLEARASRLGVSRAYLCDVEKGRRSVSVERAPSCARAGLPRRTGRDPRVAARGERGGDCSCAFASKLHEQVAAEASAHRSTRARSLGEVPRARSLGEMPRARSLGEVPRARSLGEAPQALPAGKAPRALSSMLRAVCCQLCGNDVAETAGDGGVSSC